MVSPLNLIVLYVVIASVKPEEEYDTIRDPGSLEVSSEPELSDLCLEVCDLEVTAELEKESYSSKLEGCSLSRDYHHCSTKKFHQFSLRCLDPTYASEYIWKKDDSDENQTDCSLSCLMNSSLCLMECNCIYNEINRKRDLTQKHPWHITDVKLHCQDLKLKLQEVTVYISWNLQRENNDEDVTIPRNSSLSILQNDLLLKLNETSFINKRSNSPFGIPLQPAHYAVQIFLENSDTWKEVGETNTTIMMIEHLSPNLSFQVRVSGLDIDGSKIGEDAVSPWMRTTEAHLKPKPVKNISLKNIFPGKVRRKKLRKYTKHEEWRLCVEISWEPNEDMLCSYGLVWFYPEGNDMKHIRPPKANFQAILKNIQYSRNYSLSIVAVYPELDKQEGLEEESEATWLEFVTPSCAEIWNNSLILCPPPTPENITYELIPKGDVNGSATYDLKICWSLPSYATRSEGLKTLTLKITPIANYYGESQVLDVDNLANYDVSPNNSLMGAHKKNQSMEFQVFTNTNEITIPSIVVTSDLIVTIICKSEGGASEGNLLIVSQNSYPNSESDTYPTGLGSGVMIAGVMFVTILVVSMFILFVLIRKCRKRPTEKKNQYFEDVSKVKGEEDDGNEVGGMLHELTLGSDLEVVDPEMKVGNEKEVDEFEITLNRLVIRELLGEGAFGVVYKGYYRSSNHCGIDSKRNSENLSGSLSSSWEVVAVKMLREDASIEEEKQLIHEMDTLKYLGKSSHPNVVSLIGCHTRKIKNRKLALSSLVASDVSEIKSSTSKPLLLLIVEHCALGDLQSFLQKVWQENGTSDYFKEQKDISISEDEVDQVMEQNEVKYINEISTKKLNQRALKYATLDHSSSSKEDVNIECNPIIVTNQSYGIPSGFKDNRPESGEVVDAKDLTPAYLLSYARQIVMGMEFLAGHRVVHRDLAARNVLLCGDGCTVKISDFGMSRDVYLENAYHKSSTQGKLPIKWMAPEALLHRIYTTHSDVWSFGILLWEIVTLGGTPYPGISMNEVFKLLQSGYRMEKPPNCSLELYQMMQWCWQERPSGRPSFSQLRYHLENLLEENSASTYLTLPVYVTEMNSNQLNSQGSSNCGYNDSSNIEFENHVSVSDSDSQDTFHKNDQHLLRISNFRKSSSNLTLRNEEKVECKSDQVPFQKNVLVNEGADYLTPISASVDC